MHPSLLPRYRGAAPITWALMDGVPETGVTILEMTAGKFDSGRILAQATMPVTPSICYPRLSSLLADRGADLMLESLPSLPFLKDHAMPQDHAMASPAPKIDGSFARIDFQTWTAAQTYRRFRALKGQYPLHALFQKKRLAFLEMDLLDSLPPPTENHPPGNLVFHHNQILLSLADHTWLRCQSLMLEGSKRALNANEFINGYFKPQNRSIIQLI